MTGVTRGCPQRHLPRVAFLTLANFGHKVRLLVGGHDVAGNAPVAGVGLEFAIIANQSKVLMDQAVSNRAFRLITNAWIASKIQIAID